jgi:hypothetical protein
MQSVTFYTKLNCSLCDKAYLMLMQLAFDLPLHIDVVDITHTHNKLDEAYAHRIPVIAKTGTETELEWPFTIEEIRAYLEEE